MQATDPVADVALMVAVGLGSLPGGEPVQDRPIGSDPAVLASHVAQQRVSGLVLAALDVGAFGEHSEVLRPLIEEVHLEALRTSLAAEAASVEIHQLLVGAGVGHVFLKGCATSQLDYPDPSLRVTGDVDVLVARTDHTPALRALEGSGLHRIEPPFRVGWERRYGKDIPLIGDGRVEVDLHLALDSGYFGIRMSTPALLERTETYRVAGQTLHALDPMGRLLHAAIHTATSTPVRLGSAADVIRIAGRSDFAFDEFVALVDGFGCDGLVGNGIERTWSTFGAGPTELSAWAAGQRPDEAQRRVLRGLTNGTGESRWITGLAAVPWRRRAGYVLPLVVPSRSYLTARDRTLGEHLRTSIRRIGRT